MAQFSYRLAELPYAILFRPGALGSQQMKRHRAGGCLIDTQAPAGIVIPLSSRYLENWPRFAFQEE